MPKQTFFNLPEEKRLRIIDAAINEFSTYTYNVASLNRIVENAQISKGSMYQYFVDKKDLFLYLIQHASELKLEYLDQSIMNEENFFLMLEKSIMSSTKFNLENPRFASLMGKVMNGTNPSVDDTLSYMRKASADWIQERIELAQEKGQIRKDLSLDFLTFFVNKVILDFGPYLMEKYNITYDDMSEGMPISDKTLHKETLAMLQLLREGIGI